MKRPSSLPMQISTRYLQFRQSAGIGKLFADENLKLFIASINLRIDGLDSLDGNNHIVVEFKLNRQGAFRHFLTFSV